MLSWLVITMHWSCYWYKGLGYGVDSLEWGWQIVHVGA